MKKKNTAMINGITFQSNGYLIVFYAYQLYWEIHYLLLQYLCRVLWNLVMCIENVCYLLISTYTVAIVTISSFFFFFLHSFFFFLLSSSFFLLTSFFFLLSSSFFFLLFLSSGEESSLLLDLHSGFQVVSSFSNCICQI